MLPIPPLPPNSKRFSIHKDDRGPFMWNPRKKGEEIFLVDCPVHLRKEIAEHAITLWGKVAKSTEGVAIELYSLAIKAQAEWRTWRDASDQD